MTLCRCAPPRERGPSCGEEPSAHNRIQSVIRDVDSKHLKSLVEMTQSLLTSYTEEYLFAPLAAWSAVEIEDSSQSKGSILQN